MDWIRDLDPGPKAGGRSLSRISTTSSTTLKLPTLASSEISSSNVGTRTDSRSLLRSSSSSSTLKFPVPAPSEAGSTDSGSALLPVASVPAGQLRVRSLSTTGWRPQYPRIGRFAMTPSEEIVAAGPDGLIYFMRVQDHPSKPWSEPRPFPKTKARLDSSTVTGLALHQTEKGALQVYCVAQGKMHAFTLSKDSASFFVIDSSPPFVGSKVTGTPSMVRVKAIYDDPIWFVIVPCQSGGLLCTSTRRSQGLSYGPTKSGWKTASQVAAHLSIISAVSLAVTKADKSSRYGCGTEETINIVAACIASGRLHSIEGPFNKMADSMKQIWEGAKSISIQHPGEVVGNPVLVSSQKYGVSGYKLDLLVPSAEGGIFHFIKTAKTPDEWHMIGRISFPNSVPIASSLAFARLDNDNYGHSPKFRAHVQCGGRLYLIKTTEGPSPWDQSRLYPIEGPGPFLH